MSQDVEIVTNKKFLPATVPLAIFIERYDEETKEGRIRIKMNTKHYSMDELEGYFAALVDGLNSPVLEKEERIYETEPPSGQ